MSPFGEICRFHLEIGHSRESCRSVKKKKMGWGGHRRRICESSVSVASHVGKGMVPPYSASDWLILMFFP